MENRRIIKLAGILGGALIGALLITTFSALAYDQKNTHPALTDEIVDFYNLNFSDKRLTNQEKQWLIQGAIEEDTGERPIFHFYDPVYNRGIAHFSSKDWALKPSVQANYYNSQLTGFAAISGNDSANDFSYGRALDDYAKGDRKRAFIAFGHTLHLLEDAGVPDHTRNDAHPAFIHGQESPYESEMAKWSPENFQVARKLFLTREKPVVLGSMVNYFDRIANYSNNNFFSRHTINNSTYSQPSTKITKKIKVGGVERLFIVSGDFPLAFVAVDAINSSIIDITLIKPEIGTYILDGYWDRLSKEVILNGAGALNLFIAEAEKAKTEYANRPLEKNWFAKLLGLIGVSVGDNNITTLKVVSPQGVDNLSSGDSEVTPSTKVTSQQVSPMSTVTKTPNTNVTMLSPTPSPSKTPAPTPKPSPLPISSPLPEKTEKVNINTANKELLMTLKGIKDAKSDAIIQYRVTQGPFRKIEDILNVSGIGQATFAEIKDLITVGDIVQTPAPTFVSSGGGGGGGSSSTPTPTPTPTPSPTPSPTPTPDGGTPLRAIVINEVAWMGTATSSNDEWMELYNTTSQTIDLSGWALKSLTGASPDPQISLTGSIGPFGFYLIERTDDTTISDISADKIYTGALSDTGEIIELRDASNMLQDKVSNTDGWYSGNKDTRSSMERINPKQSGDEQANWATNDGVTKNGLDAAGNPVNGTPKASNSGYVALAPSMVTNLVATLNSPLTISWSAPEDLDTLPASLSYDLRYSLDDFSNDDSIWDMATVVASSSLPNVGEKGASQSASFSVAYEYGQTLYFALKTKLSACEVDNCEESDISNIGEISFPTAIDANSWAMLGKDQYHTSFSGNLTGPGAGATISWPFDAVGAISQPVVSANGDVFFGASDGITSGLYSLDKNGAEKLPYPCVTNTKPSTSVILSDGTVYFGKDGVVAALNPDCSLKWTYDSAGTGTGPLTLAKDGSVYFASWGNNKLNALRPDGSLKWQIGNPIGNFGTFSPIILENGNIVIPARVSGHSYFYAYDLATGSQVWEATFPEGYGYLPSHPSFDLDTNKINSSVGHYLVQLTEAGELTKTPIDSNGISTTMVAVSPTDLLVGLDFTNYNLASGSQMIALDKLTKEIKWRYYIDSRINSQIAIGKDRNVYFSTQNGKLFGLNSSGGLMWTIDVSISSDISPVLTENGIIWGYGNRLVGVK